MAPRGGSARAAFCAGPELFARRRGALGGRRGLSFVSPWHTYTVNTGIGDPTKATAEKGRRMIEAAVDRLATSLKDLSDAPMDELFPYRD